MASEMPVLPEVAPGWCSRGEAAGALGLLDHGRAGRSL